MAETGVWVPRSKMPLSRTAAASGSHWNTLVSPQGSAATQAIRQDQKGLQLCRLFARGGAELCKGGDTCIIGVHVPLEQRPPCVTYGACGVCPRGEECWWPHIAPEPFIGATLAVQCAVAQAERVAARLEAL